MQNASYRIASRSDFESRDRFALHGIALHCIASIAFLRKALQTRKSILLKDLWSKQTSRVLCCIASRLHLHSHCIAFALHLHYICVCICIHIRICIALHSHRICIAFASHRIAFLITFCIVFASHLHCIALPSFAFAFDRVSGVAAVGF